ncbi:MAG TPA: AtpZ/AtpI family protein [Candidatus Angelobacter sp.]|nr:AtpZ/AtpI family protein [Candidatus Angelobacter sp.]
MPDEQSPKKQWMNAEKYIQAGLGLPAATFIGWAIGTLLDRWLHKNWIYVVGLLVGIVAGFVQLIRVAMSAESKN